MENLESRFWNLFNQSPILSSIIDGSPDLNIPNWYCGAGCLAQTIWNLEMGKAPNEHINDVDWIYFDGSDLSEEGETKITERVREHFKDISLEIDVVNQARVHLWYKKKFGYDIAPYASSQAAICTWPTTATAVAVTKSKGERVLFAPFGLRDLMSLTVRPNKVQITEQIYLAKANRWKQCWPSLKVIDWKDV